MKRSVAIAVLAGVMFVLSAGAAFAEPVTYGLVVDNTVSHAEIQKAIDTGLLFVESSGSDCDAFIVRIGAGGEAEIVQDLTPQKAGLTEALDNMFAESGPSKILDSIQVSAQYLIQNTADIPAGQKRALILITSGREASSYYKIEDVMSLLRQNGIKVYAVGIDTEEGAKVFLRKLAGESGGKAYFPASGTEAKEAAQEIFTEEK